MIFKVQISYTTFYHILAWMTNRFRGMSSRVFPRKMRVSLDCPEELSCAQNRRKQESARKRGLLEAAFLRAKQKKARKRA
jgi:hypothetical protein